jgi:hypothetical protein
VDYCEHELQEAEEKWKVMTAGQQKSLGKLKQKVNTAIIRDLEQSYQLEHVTAKLVPGVGNRSIPSEAPEDEDDLSNLEAGPLPNSDASFQKYHAPRFKLISVFEIWYLVERYDNETIVS